MRKRKNLGAYIFLVILAFICITPFYIMFVNATHSNADIVTKVNMLPGKHLKDNYASLLDVISPWRMLLNSTFLTVTTTFLTAYFGALTAYGFSVYKFKGSTIAFWLIISTMMIPPQMLLIGTFQIFREVGIIDSYIPIILPQVAKAATIFWLKGYFDKVMHHSLLEAARVEGMGELRIFHSLGLPLAKTGIATISIFNFVQVWNNYITPVTMLTSSEKYPISVGVAVMKRLDPVDAGAVYAILVISVIPILIMYILFSKQILGDITSGSIKG